MVIIYLASEAVAQSCFVVNFAKFLRASFSQNFSGPLFLRVLWISEGMYSRSSHQWCSVKKLLRLSLFFIRLQARPATLSKKTPKKVFFYEYCKTFKNTYFVIEKKIFFEKIFVFLQNIYYLQKKSFYMEKQVL